MAGADIRHGRKFQEDGYVNRIEKIAVEPFSRFTGKWLSIFV
jgi:hypothetical protein